MRHLVANMNRYFLPVHSIFVLIVLIVIGGCSFGQSNTQPEDSPIQLDTYESPSAVGDEQSDGGSQAAAGADSNSNAEQQPDATVQDQSDSASGALAADARPSIPLFDQSSYNGEIEADETVNVMSEVSGKVLDVMVQVGDRVTAGQVLVRIDSSVLEAQQAQALAGLKAAKAQLDQILAAADPETLEAAEAAVNAAAVAYREVTKGASEEDLTIAESQRRQAEAAVRVAQAAYNDVKGNPKISMMPQSQQLEQATLALEAATAQYQKVVDGARDDAIAGAYANLIQARTQLANLQEGAKPEQIRAAEAQIEQAEAALYLTALQVTKTTVTAPMDGIVLSKNVAAGSMAAPGSPLLVLMSNVVNVTIPVEESRMAQLMIGQPALLQVNAYPGQQFEGEIIRIAPQLDSSTRTVNVTIRPSGDSEAQLVPGMFATVELLN